MKSLEEAQRYAENYPDQVSIRREVRYYALVNGITYWLEYDWMIEELENKLWHRDHTPEDERR